MSEETKITPKQERFCQEYLIDLNGTQAAIRSGYSNKTANEQAAQLLAKLSIQNRIAELQKSWQEKTGITVNRVLQEYSRIAFQDVRNFFDKYGNIIPITELDEDTARSIAGIEHIKQKRTEGDEVEIEEYIKKIKSNDKIKALDSLARHLGMFKDSLDLLIINKEEVKKAINEIFE